MINKNYIATIVGMAIIAAGVLTKPPLTLNYLTYAEGVFTKYVIIAVGLTVCTVSLYQIIRKKLLIGKETVKRAVILLFMVAVFLIFIEAYLRISAPSDAFRDDEIYHHSMVPNFTGPLITGEFNAVIKVNSFGLRSPEIQAKSEKYRILVLGDSFTWGFGVDFNQTFVKRLGDALGNKYEVINGGATSYSPTLEYLYMREKGMQLKPDMVLLAFDMSDVFDDNVYERYAVFNESDIVKVPAQKAGMISQITSSKVFVVVKGLIESLYSRMENKPVITDSPYLNDPNSDKYAIMRFNNNTYGVEWNRTFKYIKKLDVLLKENNMSFAIIVYPYGNQVNGREWQRGRFTFAFAEGVTYPDTPARVLEDFGKRENITVINAFDAFRNSTMFPLFYSFDGHFTASGHNILAEVIYSKLFG